jgi:hypothetical protein
MKKITFIVLSLFLVFKMTAQKIDFPMTGSWFSPKTNQLFMIATDKDGTIKGKGVYFRNANHQVVQMQIMTQTTQPIESGENAYLLRIYDPAKPKMVYELVTYPGAKELVLKVTETGKRNQATIFYNLNDLKPKEKHNEDN